MTESSTEKSSVCGKLRRCYHKYGLKRILPLCLLILYSFVGAWIFMTCEKENDLHRRIVYRDHVDHARQNFISALHVARKEIEKGTANFKAGDISSLKHEDWKQLKPVYESLAAYLGTALYLSINWYSSFDAFPDDIVLANQIPRSSHVLFSRIFEELILLNHTEAAKSKKTDDAIGWFEKGLKLQRWEETELTESPWTLWGSLVYAGTIYTTIGYGHIVAITTRGRICTVFYALLGVPLFLTILNLVGKSLMSHARDAWNQSIRSFRRLSRTKRERKLSRVSVTSSRDMKGMMIDENDKLEHAFPVSLALFILLAWIFICAGIFCVAETSWNYWTAAYFFFISIATIGLGDLTPEDPKSMIMLFLLIVIGLALLSLCFNVIQARIEDLIEHMLSEMEQNYIHAILQETAEVDISPMSEKKRFSIPSSFADLVVKLMAKNAKSKPPKVETEAPEQEQADEEAAPPEENVPMKDTILFSMLNESRIKAMEARIKKQTAKRHVAVQANLLNENNFRKSRSRWKKIMTAGSNEKSDSLDPDAETLDQENSSGITSYYTAAAELIRTPPIQRLDPILLFTEEPTDHMIDISIPTTPEMIARRSDWSRIFGIPTVSAAVPSVHVSRHYNNENQTAPLASSEPTNTTTTSQNLTPLLSRVQKDVDELNSPILSKGGLYKGK